MSGIELPGYAEPVDRDDDCRWVRCTICENEAPNLSLLEHDCIYKNDLIADGGWEVQPNTEWCKKCGQAKNRHPVQHVDNGIACEQYVRPVTELPLSDYDHTEHVNK